MNNSVPYPYPNPSQCVLYKGILYCARDEPPSKVLKEGLKPVKTSYNIRDYLVHRCYRTGSIGVSTTRLYGVATIYARNKSSNNKTCYIYKINYKGNQGIDVFNSISSPIYKMGHEIYSTARGHKRDEINITGTISPEEIIEFQTFRNGCPVPSLNEF